ncbi:DUF805 domain-containing protein [Macrococcus animalis]|uniref:DUF805 domain-containing protein n=1 Tax=Macrococcus animalis TaxID=3395467 RepID=UPI0039BEB1EF
MFKRMKEMITFQGRLTRPQFLIGLLINAFMLIIIVVLSVIGALYSFDYFVQAFGKSISFIFIMEVIVAGIIGIILFCALLLPLLIMTASLIIRRTRDTRVHWIWSLGLYILLILINLFNTFGIPGGSKELNTFLHGDNGDSITIILNIYITLCLFFILLQPSRKNNDELS